MTRRPDVQSGIITAVFAAALLWCSALAAQSAPDRVAVPLTDPARPVQIKASLVNGSITVKVHANQNVIVEARARKGEDEREQPGGRRRVFIPSTGLTV